MSTLARWQSRACHALELCRTLLALVEFWRPRMVDTRVLVGVLVGICLAAALVDALLRHVAAKRAWSTGVVNERLAIVFEYKGQRRSLCVLLSAHRIFWKAEVNWRDPRAGAMS